MHDLASNVTAVDHSCMSTSADNKPPVGQCAYARFATDAKGVHVQSESSVALAQAALDALCLPPVDFLESLDRELRAIDLHTMKQHKLETTKCLRHLAEILFNIGSSQIDWGRFRSPLSRCERCGRNVLNFSGARSEIRIQSTFAGSQPCRQSSVLVEDVTDQIKHHQPATLSAAAVAAACALNAEAPKLHSDWVDEATDSAAASVLQRLLDHAPLDVESYGSRAEQIGIDGTGCTKCCSGASEDVPESTAAMQLLLLHLLPEVLAQLQPRIWSAHDQTATSASRDSPDEMSRTFAARSIVWIVLQLHGNFLEAALHCVLPALLTFLDDTSSCVKCVGFSALHHVALAAPPGCLRQRQELLSDVMTKSIVGSDNTVWPVLAPAACDLMAAIFGTDDGHGIWSLAFHRFTRGMLSEAELHSQDVSRSIVWLTAMHPVLRMMQTAAVQYFARLMPLLLTWLACNTARLQGEAVSILTTITLTCWPRMDIHASFLLAHLKALKVADPEGRVSAAGNTEILHRSALLSQLLQQLVPVETRQTELKSNEADMSSRSLAV